MTLALAAAAAAAAAAVDRRWPAVETAEPRDGNRQLSEARWGLARNLTTAPGAKHLMEAPANCEASTVREVGVAIFAFESICEC